MELLSVLLWATITDPHVAIYVACQAFLAYFAYKGILDRVQPKLEPVYKPESIDSGPQLHLLDMPVDEIYFADQEHIEALMNLEPVVKR